MRNADVIVVGGGPAGSAAAARLRRGGLDVLVLDREEFPRHKLCAGWITPQVLADLAFDAGDYPHGFLSFRRLHWYLKRLHLPVPCLQHSIRRFEFDAWLLERSGAAVARHAVKEIRADGEGFTIDGEYRCRYLVGAGGTGCPVHRAFFRDAHPRLRSLQTVTLEIEFACDWTDPDCRLWFFDHGLPGYSWYVPKANGWLNVGIGALAERLKQRGDDIWGHWRRFARLLERRFAIRPPREPTGYSYYLRPPADHVRRGNAFLAGDAAGLATRDLCEGIGPAIRSGQRAAAAILDGTPYDLGDLSCASLGGLAMRAMDFALQRGALPRPALPQKGASR
ncbi:MAG: NAD(P)/FAD-dependent oxidoreductase [Gammaproteobacteria bacterium]|nr:NAD(P)/FAD-dependent oxidoreductase [Gammaproteobacteria bacterium]